MNLKKDTPEFLSFLSTYLAEGAPEADEATIKSFMAAAESDRRQVVFEQIQKWVHEANLPLEDFGTEANRWFADSDEAREWLRNLASYMKDAGTESGISVKDSNGTVLVEGDSVQVIKDLKVKGGSSDLKRGTVIKKVHLIDDPAVIECRVGGSTLVLKTCFLKKV